MFSGVVKAWAASVAKLESLPQENRWNGVTGFVDSIVCVLLTLGVVPNGPVEWSTEVADWLLYPSQFPEHVLRRVIARIISVSMARCN